MKISALFAAFLLIFTGCAGPVDPGGTDVVSEPTVITPGGTVNLQMRPPDTLNPLLTAYQSNTFILDMVYDSLVVLDDRFEPVGLLAQSWGYSNDMKTLTVQLKRAITWHDGKPFRATDVVHTFKSIKNGNSYLEPVVAPFKSARTKSEVEVEFELLYPLATAHASLTFPIIPAHKTDIDKIPCGTGMMKFSAMDKKYLDLTVNKDYTLGSLPYIDDVRVILVANDDNARNLFAAGDIDAVTSALIPPGSFTSRGSVKQYHTPNLEIIKFGRDENLASVKLRQAVMHAIDRDRVVSDAYFNFAVASADPIHPKYYLAGDQKFHGQYNKEKAMQLLFEAGYTDSDGDGFVDKSDGKKAIALKLRFIVDSEQRSRTMAADIIAQNLLDCGIMVEVVPLEPSMFLAYFGSGNFDLAFSGVRLPNDMRLDGLEHIGLPLDGLDSLWLTNSSSAAEDLAQICDSFAQQPPFVPICFINGAIYHTAYIGMVNQPRYPFLFKNINTWHY